MPDRGIVRADARLARIDVVDLRSPFLRESVAQQRAKAGGTPVRSSEAGDLDARFRVLVQSPLRAGILRDGLDERDDADDRGGTSE